MKRRIFLSDEWERQMDQQGFVQIPFLEEEEIRACREIFEATPPATGEAFHTSHWNRNPEYRKAVHEQLLPLLARKAEILLSDYVAAYAYFLVKHPGAGSEVRPHQDWTLVDESRFRSLILWCPLSDTDDKNGCFHYAPGSHKILKNVRGTGIEPGYSHLLDEIEKNIFVPVPLKAGEALIFDMRLLHGSPANVGSQARVVVGLALKPVEAEFLHWAKDNGSGQIRKWKGSADFLLEFAFGDSPAEKLMPTPVIRNENFVYERAEDLRGAKDSSDSE